MEERMTQEPKETATEEPQVGAEVTDEGTPQEQGSADEIDETAGEITVDSHEEASEEEMESAAEASEPDDEEGAKKQDADDQKPIDGKTDEVTAEALEEAEESEEEATDSAEEDSEGPSKETTDGQTQPEDAEEGTPTVESVVEAILFATDEPLTANRLASIVETTSKQVKQCIKDLNAKYEKNHNAFRIEQIAGGHQMLTLDTYNTWLRKMLKVRGDSKLSPAALETLAIIAYKQPVIRVDIEAIRGVAAGEVIRSLMYKGLVKIVGRAEILGRPLLYGTTKKFLGVFGLNSLKDLPKAEELKKPD